MKEVLDDLEQGKYKRNMVKNTEIDGDGETPSVQVDTSGKVSG